VPIRKPRVKTASDISPGVAVKIPRYLYESLRARAAKELSVGMREKTVARLLFELLDPEKAKANPGGMQ
jgi:hypothetical protein